MGMKRNLDQVPTAPPPDLRIPILLHIGRRRSRASNAYITEINDWLSLRSNGTGQDRWAKSRLWARSAPPRGEQRRFPRPPITLLRANQIRLRRPRIQGAG